MIRSYHVLSNTSVSSDYLLVGVLGFRYLLIKIFGALEGGEDFSSWMMPKLYVQVVSTNIHYAQVILDKGMKFYQQPFFYWDLH